MDETGTRQQVVMEETSDESLNLVTILKLMGLRLCPPRDSASPESWGFRKVNGCMVLQYAEFIIKLLTASLI